MKTCRWDFISTHASQFGVQRLCRVLGASRSGYCRWQAGAAARRQRAEAEASTVAEIRAVHDKHRGCYGAPCVHAELRDRGRVGELRIHNSPPGSYPYQIGTISGGTVGRLGDGQRAGVRLGEELLSFRSRQRHAADRSRGHRQFRAGSPPGGAVNRHGRGQPVTSMASTTIPVPLELGFFVLVAVMVSVWVPEGSPVLLNTSCWNCLPHGA